MVLSRVLWGTMNTPAPSTISTAAALGTIFAHMGQMADLQEVIIHTRSSLELYPPGHPDRSSPLANFAIVLHYHTLKQVKR